MTIRSTVGALLGQVYKLPAGGRICNRVLTYTNNRRGSVCARKSFAPTKDSQIAIFRAFLRFSFHAASFSLLLTFRIMFVFVAVCSLESLHGKASTLSGSLSSYIEL